LVSAFLCAYADAKAYAAATLPTLKAHLKKIRAIASAQGVDIG
jgi:hypothetical protein